MCCLFCYSMKTEQYRRRCGWCCERGGVLFVGYIMIYLNCTIRGQVYFCRSLIKELPTLIFFNLSIKPIHE